LSGDAWEEANQRRLAAEVARVRATVERLLEPERAPAPEPPAPPGGPAAAVDSLAAAFGLTPFERDVLLLAAGVELDGSLAAVCARAQPELGVGAPTFSLALAALEGAHWSALSPDRPLRRWRLLDLSDSGSLVAAPLRVDERVLHFLAGVRTSDERLHGIARPLEPGRPSPAYAEVAHRVASCLRGGSRVELHGGGRDARASVAAAAAAELDLAALELRAADIPPAAADRLATPSGAGLAARAVDDGALLRDRRRHRLPRGI